MCFCVPLCRYPHILLSILGNFQLGQLYLQRDLFWKRFYYMDLSQPHWELSIFISISSIFPVFHYHTPACLTLEDAHLSNSSCWNGAGECPEEIKIMSKCPGCELRELQIAEWQLGNPEIPLRSGEEYVQKEACVCNIQNGYTDKEYSSEGIIKFQVLTKSGKCSLVSSGFPPLRSAEHLVYACATNLKLHPSGSTLFCRNIFTISHLKSFRQTETLPSYSHEIYSVLPFSSKRDNFCLKYKHTFSYKTGPENFLSIAAGVPYAPIRLFKVPSSLVCLKCPTPVTNPVHQREMLYDWGFHNLWLLSLLTDTNDWIDCTHTDCYWPLLETRYKNNYALAGDCQY